MLVVSRYERENVIVTLENGLRGIVSIAAIRMDHRSGQLKVRLGFEFPKSVTIHRAEVQNEIDGIDPQAKPSVAAILGHRKD